MSKKYNSVWKWLLTIYSIYFGIYLFLLFVSGGASIIQFIFIAAGNFTAIFSTYQLMQNYRLTWKKPVRFSLFGLYVIFAAVNTLIFSIGLFNNTEVYFADKAGLVLDILGISLPLIALYPVTRLFLNLEFSGKNFLRYLWTGYLWSIAILFSVCLAFLLPDIKKWTIYDHMTLIPVIALLINFYSYFYRIKIFPTIVWKVIFWFNALWVAIDFLYSHGGLKQYLALPDYWKSYYQGDPFSLTAYIILTIIFLPTYYPLFKLAFDKNFFDRR